MNIIIGESEKKERWEEPGSSNREKMGENINQIIQTMSQQGKKPIIIITIVRIVGEEFNIIIIWFPTLPVCENFYHQIFTVRKIEKYLGNPTYFKT